MDITSQTRALGLIGHPVSHSKSPEMMNAALRSLQQPYVYLAHDVAPSVLEEVVRGFRYTMRGWNVTIPHKVAIIPFLDELDHYAQEIGAVNTVVVREGTCVGYNTDGIGYVRSLQEEVELELSQARVLIVGAGGAARAVGYALAQVGVKEISIANRTLAKAKALADHLSRFTMTQAVPLDQCRKQVENATLIVNTTSVGMFPHVDEMPISSSWISAEQIMSDLIYHPQETLLLQEAKKRGAFIHTGLGMLVHQAAVAFELWTGQQAPISLMRQILKQSLKK
ncbi:shikimate dehydrogenase [Hazenella coriacea]|uniref:Shikimate dehydrogenase (NADP(+)) n=1 Tax=Hazenella coriacea TaxID=1179467 RepID=A0A4R3L4U7_9BACL|nr:shikimate dehydrogenase [Hazenella coriacea]TCS94801.1 shikimate dehydrogenase [Hazenella coriacea]